ncbi:hypothetical protein [Methyloversatilis sp.]|uniref:hypothetical protein n=1 Tax=Methyloversatilis sp. TaxID=2569862 RepID=UPI0035B25DBD
MFSTDQFQFNKQTRTLLGYSRDLKLVQRFPEKLEVRSAHTGKIAVFEQDRELAIANEFWDGEQCVYRSKDTDTRLVLFPY